MKPDADKPIDYRPGSKNAHFATLLLRKKTIAQIEALDYPDKGKHDGVTIARVRRELIAAGKLKEEDSPIRSRGRGRPRTKPVIQFHGETKAFKIYALMQANKTDAEIIAAGYTKPDIYAVRAQVKKKTEAGRPGTALVVHQETKGRGVKAWKARQKANGHAPLANGHFSVPIIEVIFHTPDGREVPLFSTADAFPEVYAFAARKILGDSK